MNDISTWNSFAPLSDECEILGNAKDTPTNRQNGASMEDNSPRQLRRGNKPWPDKVISSPLQRDTTQYTERKVRDNKYQTRSKNHQRNFYGRKRNSSSSFINNQRSGPRQVTSPTLGDWVQATESFQHPKRYQSASNEHLRDHNIHSQTRMTNSSSTKCDVDNSQDLSFSPTGLGNFAKEPQLEEKQLSWCHRELATTPPIRSNQAQSAEISLLPKRFPQPDYSSNGLPNAQRPKPKPAYDASSQGVELNGDVAQAQFVSYAAKAKSAVEFPYQHKKHRCSVTTSGSKVEPSSLPQRKPNDATPNPREFNGISPSKWQQGFRPGPASNAKHKSLMEQTYQAVISTINLLALPLALKDPVSHQAIRAQHLQILHLTSTSLHLLEGNMVTHA